MDYLRSSIKVAIFFLIACAVLAYFSMHAGQVRLMGETQNYKLLFSSLGNLKLDSPVTYSGFKVGQVVQVRILSAEERTKYEKDIEVSVRLSRDVIIRKDSDAEIRSLGFLGEKYIELTPGGKNSESLPEGSVIVGRSPSDITDVMEKFGKELDEMLPVIKDTMNKIHSSVTRVDEVVQQIANEKKIQGLVDQAQDLTKRMNGILKENRKHIRETFQNMHELSGNVKDEFKQAAPKIQSLLEKMNSAVQEMDGLLKEAKTLIHSNSPGIDRMMKNLEETSEHAKEFMRTLRNEPWKLLARPRATPPSKAGPKRGFAIYKTNLPEKQVSPE